MAVILEFRTVSTCSFVIAAFLAVQLFSVSWGFPNENQPLNLNVSQEESNNKRDASCFDSLSRPYTEIIPNPYDCSLFFKCTIVLPGEPFHPAPVHQECRPGLGLCFDMIRCRCEYCHDIETVCYDMNNPEHNTDEFRLRCACPMDMETGLRHEYCPDLESRNETQLSP